MIDRPKNLVVVTTEVGLLWAFIYLHEYGGHDTPAVWVLLKASPQRFNDLCFDILPGSVRLVDDKLGSSLLFPEKKFYKNEIYEEFDCLIYQNPTNFSTQAILSRSKKYWGRSKKVIVSDGLVCIGAQGVRTKLTLLSKLYFRKIVNRISGLNWSVRSYNNCINEADLLIAHQKVNEKDFLPASRLLECVHKYRTEILSLFNCKESEVPNCSIIFFTQPFDCLNNISGRAKEEYWRMISDICKHCTEMCVDIVIKVHPAESTKKYEKFSNEFVHIPTINNVPGEVFVALSQSKIILSACSSVSLNIVDPAIENIWLGNLIGLEQVCSVAPKNINVVTSWVEVFDSIDRVCRPD